MTHAYGRATSLIAATMLSLGVAGTAQAQSPVTLTIATVNNDDMIAMQKLSPQFERQHPDIKLRWVVLEENVLRQRVTPLPLQEGPREAWQQVQTPGSRPTPAAAPSPGS